MKPTATHTLQARGHLGVAAAVSALCVFVSALAWAGVPPFDLAKKRLATMREQAGATSVDVVVSVTDEGMTTYRTEDAALVSGGALQLSKTGGKATLKVHQDAPFPWNVVYELLVSADPISGLERHLGSADASQTEIVPREREFLYIYGDDPKIAVSRDMSAIRSVWVTHDKKRWEFRTTGTLGAADLPERLHVLRSKEPYATVELSRDEPKAK